MDSGGWGDGSGVMCLKHMLRFSFESAVGRWTDGSWELSEQ